METIGFVVVVFKKEVRVKSGFIQDSVSQLLDSEYPLFFDGAGD
jgi:hypothetical protein